MIAADQKHPAVLIVNPSAGRLSHASRDSVARALDRHFELEAVVTTGRNTGIGLAADAAADGVPLVIAFGGDGHVNEVVNGLVGTNTSVAIIPGGTMNVFARSLGIPRDPHAAVTHLGRLSKSDERSVHLGVMDDRYFTFAAGCGFDAEAARLVENDLSNKRRFGELFFYWSALRILAGAYRHRSPSMSLEGDFGQIEVAMTIACNAGPYAYFLGRAVRLTPEVDLGEGLDLFALRKMKIEALPFYTWRATLGGSMARHKDAVYKHDLEEFTLRSDSPFPRHVDGETLEPSATASFKLAREILRVRA
jgi:diacylglycerol kinase family enzyme